MDDLSKKVEELKDDIIKSTQEILRFKSVEEDPRDGMPFGEGVNDCLKYALDLSEKLGFEPKNFDNYAGHAEFGDGDEIVGILVHLDVVPEGSDWTYDPYGGEIHDNKIYGRGTIDDKGPAIASLYAMKALKDSGLSINKKVRIIFGTNEESGWKGIDYYLKQVEAPNIAFVPDADFPAIHGEKGIIIFDFNKKFDARTLGDGVKVLSIKGGNRANMVPDYAEAHVISDNSIVQKLHKYTQDNNFNIKITDAVDKYILESYGVSAHGSLPGSGQNAISQLMMFLASLDLADGDVANFIKFYNNKIGMEYNGKSIGCDFKDDESGPLVFNVGVINLDKESVKLTINIRYPISLELDDLLTTLEKQIIDFDITMDLHEHKPPLYVPKDHELVRKLMRVYREFTGDDRDAITIGGGTYARAMDNAVAFGPLFPGQPELAHQRDEFIGVEDLIKITKIYANALYELAK